MRLGVPALLLFVACLVSVDGETNSTEVAASWVAENNVSLPVNFNKTNSTLLEEVVDPFLHTLSELSGNGTLPIVPVSGNPGVRTLFDDRLAQTAVNYSGTNFHDWYTNRYEQVVSDSEDAVEDVDGITVANDFDEEETDTRAGIEYIRAPYRDFHSMRGDAPVLGVTTSCSENQRLQGKVSVRRFLQSLSSATGSVSKLIFKNN